MNKLIKPYSLLFYLLVILLFFFLGVIYASLVDAGKNQGLAGGAIVLFHGVISALCAFLVSLFTVYKLDGKIIIKINKILGLILIVCCAYFSWNYYSNIKPKREQQQKAIPKKPTPTTKSPLAISNINTTNQNKGIATRLAYC